MPTPAQGIQVAIWNRSMGRGKHYTTAEIEKRAAEEEKLKRRSVKLKAPAFLREQACDNALKIWKEIVREGTEIELFDNVDARVLANFCRYQALLEEEAQKNFPDRKRLDSYGKQVLAYAEKLGLTPTARARLVIKRANLAQETEDEEMDALMA